MATTPESARLNRRTIPVVCYHDTTVRTGALFRSLLPYLVYCTVNGVGYGWSTNMHVF
ncbi:hypothetical protein M426DRAFT_317716 [Hypoxylon sp. CI-4A]|nr:hypothetical protein M426DRAFT_317716 [Hypoxylon sp. CI-4A]